MAVQSYDLISVGDQLPPLSVGPITRSTLALYAGASGDHHPLHIDSDYAKAKGAGDVFAHGMLVMAYLGRLLTNWTPQTGLREFSARFGAITHLQDVLICQGTVTDKLMQDGEKLVRLDLSVVDEGGERKIVGQALVALP